MEGSKKVRNWLAKQKKKTKETELDTTHSSPT